MCPEMFPEQERYCAYSHFSAMLSRSGEDWWLGMFEFEVYWDNSEPEPATATTPAFPMAIAACYIAHKEQWDQFTRSWDDARREEGFDFFHMTDFMANRECGIKPYCDWNQGKRDRVYYRLANIINTRIRTGFACGVPSESYDRSMPDHIRLAIGKKHFTFAVRSILSVVQRWYKIHGHGKATQYIFDRMGKGKGEIISIFDALDESGDNQLFGKPKGQGFGFQDKECFKPLQAADILAWNMRDHMRDAMNLGMPDSPPRLSPYFQFLRKVPIRLFFFRDAQIEEAAANMVEYEEREGKPAFKTTRSQLKQWKRNAAKTI